MAASWVSALTVAIIVLFSNVSPPSALRLSCNSASDGRGEQGRRSPIRSARPVRHSEAIDDRSEVFHFAREAKWDVCGGRAHGLRRDPVYTGRSIQSWRTCLAIGGPSERRPWSVSYR